MFRTEARSEGRGAAESILRILHVLLGVVCIETGSSVTGMLLPIRAGLEGFPLWSIGLLGAAYYAGFAIGCVSIPGPMHRIGHIRVFSGFAALAASTLLVHPFAVSEPVWLALRLVTGFCFAGLYLAVESWLNAGATVADRGRIMAAYMVASWLAVIAGKLLFIPLGAAGTLPFAAVSIAICLSVVAVAFSPTEAPAPGPAVRLRPAELFRIAPVGAAGCLASGAANGAFWSLAPVYAVAHGLDDGRAGIFMVAAVLGGAVAQWPLGWWSDRTDRRVVVAAAALTAAASGAALAAVTVLGTWTMLVLAPLFGAAALPLYSVAVAHANDRAPAGAFVEVSGDLLLMFGVGAALGPVPAGLLMEAHPGAVFAWTAAVHLAVGLLALDRIRREPPVPEAEKAGFVAIPRTTQAVLPLDPRADGPAPDGEETTA